MVEFSDLMATGYGLIGGVGLFLLGMRLMTEGLKYAAGDSLRSILVKSTKTRMRGILTGAFLTSLVQSSSAVTVAAIGFVNAGLVDFAHAVTLVYGCNIGTTMTGWLVSLVGFSFEIKAFALPAIGVGMLLRVFGGESRRGALGDVFAGFGIFFLGIEVLKKGFADFEQAVPITSLVAANGGTAQVFFVGIGFLMTVLMQSSSASIAVILTAAAGNVLPIENAAAAVIGANVGTTSTAALAVIGATSNAKRLAALHVLFNVITGIVALLLLPFLLDAINSFEMLMDRTPSTTKFLALFHTTFNVLGVLILFPMTASLVSYLQQLFRSDEEDEARSRHLDGNVVGTPVLALRALAMELRRIGDIAKRMANGAISSESGPGPKLFSDKEVVDSLVAEVALFGNNMQRSNLPVELDHQLPNAFRVSGYYHDIAELSLEAARLQSVSMLTDPELNEELITFKGKVVRFLELADSQRDDYSTNMCKEALAVLKDDYRTLKARLLRVATKGDLSVGQMVRSLDLIARLRRMAEQAEKGARYMALLDQTKSVLDHEENAQVELEPPSYHY